MVVKGIQKNGGYSYLGGRHSFLTDLSGLECKNQRYCLSVY